MTVVIVSLPYQIQARMDTIKQRLQSDPQFRQGFGKQVAKEMHNEQVLESQLAKQVYTTIAIVHCNFNIRS